MMRIFLLLLFLSIARFSFGQEVSVCDSITLRVKADRDSLSRFTYFMKGRAYGLSFHITRDRNYSMGVGYYFYSFGWPYRKLTLPTIETNLNYHLDKLLHHNLAIGLPFLVSPKLNLSTYTDFNSTSVFIRPGIAVNAFVVEFNYAYSWKVSDEIGFGTRHTFSLIFRPGIPRHVWKSPGDRYQSQYDRRRLR